MQLDTRTGEVFDEDDWTDVDLDHLPNFFTPERVQNEGKDVRKFSASHMEALDAHLRASSVLPLLKSWREADRAGKHAGGRPPTLGDREILLLCFLMRGAGNGFLIQELAKTLAYNLDDSAKALLGIDRVRPMPLPHVEEKLWYHRARRALVSILKLIDSHPGKRVMYTQEERRALFANRDPVDQEMRKERAAQFNAELLLMTYRMQPRRLRRRNKWKGVATVDQTALPAVSQSMPRKMKNGVEEVVRRKADGTVVERYVLEPDAGPYPKKGSRADREKGQALATSEFEQDYMLSVTLMAQVKPTEKKEHVNLVLASSVTAPNQETGAQVVRGLKYVKPHIPEINVLVGDRAYGAGQKVEEYHEPLRQLGVGVLTGYKGGDDDRTQLGPKGGYAGAILTEGEFFCCGTPKKLLTAARDHERGEIDEETMIARLEERRQYRLRAKERPAADGSQPMMCPAYGPQATVECPLRQIHPKSSAKIKPVVLDANLPPAPDRICTQTSVKFEASIGQKYRQKYSYMSRDWMETMRVGRNTVESFNEELKQDRGSIVEPRRRRMRGLTALYFMTTVALAQINIERIARFLKAEEADQAAEQRGKPRRPRTLIRARDRFRKSGYFRGDRFSIDGVTRTFEVPDPPQRT